MDSSSTLLWCCDGNYSLPVLLFSDLEKSNSHPEETVFVRDREIQRRPGMKNELRISRRQMWLVPTAPKMMKRVEHNLLVKITEPMSFRVLYLHLLLVSSNLRLSVHGEVFECKTQFFVTLFFSFQ